MTTTPAAKIAPRKRVTEILEGEIPVNPSAVRADKPQDVAPALAVVPEPTPVAAQKSEPAPAPVAVAAPVAPAPVAQQEIQTPPPGPTWHSTRPSPTSGQFQKMSQISVPLDPDRYYRMSIARVHTGLKGKDIMTEALDMWLKAKGF